MIIAQDNLDGESMKQLRLASTTLAQLLTPLLFEVLVMNPHVDNLEKAYKIAEIPLLARHVHVLEIYSRIAPEIRYPNMRDFVRTVSIWSRSTLNYRWWTSQCSLDSTTAAICQSKRSKRHIAMLAPQMSFFKPFLSFQVWRASFNHISSSYCTRLTSIYRSASALPPNVEANLTYRTLD